MKIINEVARRLPLGDTTIAHVSYHATIHPPKNINPDDNVRLVYAPRERCYKHTLDECQVNRKYLDYLKGQIQLFPNGPEIFEYYNDMILFRALPMPLHPIIGKDTKVYREAGAKRILALSFVQFSKWAYGPNFYVLGKCLWRGEGDPQDIVEYCDAVYGPHAKVMKKYFDLLFEFCATVMQVCGYEMGTEMRQPPDNQPYAKTHVASLAPLVREEHLDSIEGLLKDAIACAQEPYRTRIENQLLIWNFARIEVPTIYRTLLAGYLKSDLGQDATDGDRQYVIALIKKVLEDMDKASEIILSAPEELRGTLYRNKGSMWRRFERLKKSLCSGMERFEKQQEGAEQGLKPKSR
ncbi:MAG: DUF4838 domain-containing protein [Planctomycetota bacterium]|nr:MAG: DUF4838 domain-containing protein [Planctomycetota bacterium]